MNRSTVRRIVIRTAAMAAIASAIAMGPVSQAQAGGGDGNWRPGRVISSTK